MAKALARAKKSEQRHPETTEDAFVEGVLRLWTWVRHNLRNVLLIGGTVAALVAGGLYYRGYRQTVREQAALDLADIRATLAQDPVGTTARLESFVNRYDGTTAAAEGRLLLARVQLDAGQPEQVLETLGGVDASLDTPLGFGAALLRASAQQELGDVEAALRQLDRLGRGARYPFQRRYARALAGQLLADAGRLEEALARFSTLIAETEDPVERGSYEVRLGEIRGLLHSRAAAESPGRDEPGS